MKKLAIGSFLAACLSITCLNAIAATPASTASDEKIIRAQADDYAKQFQAKNAAALAAMWTVDGDWTDENGTVARGRENIEKRLDSYFKDRSAQPIKVSIESLKFPADNVAVEEGTCTLLSDSVPVSAGRYSVVHVKKDGQWQMMSVTETTCPQPESSISELGWFIGLWNATGDKGTVHLQASWDPGHHFITFDDSGATGQPLSIIGFDPISRQLVVWHFDEDGGYGRGILMRKGENTWVEISRGVQPDGNISRARYVIRKVNNDKFTWQSTDRRIAGRELPDCQEITVAREYSTK
ncbi:MAG TPA: SgcJ/EcaC family oxidoreductase [Planktothrix sp.]|jgi:uncharacterized protein (TIGR02246 family)